MFKRKLLGAIQALQNSAHVRNKSYTSGDYCLNIVRAYDNENFLCSLLLSSEIRTTALAVRAFNAEVASVQDQVTQTHLGAMRLKFWEESIDKVYSNNVPNNPVAVELSKAVKRHKLSKEHLKKLVICRTRRLDQTSFSTMREMESYADASCSSVLLLLLEAANVKTPEAKSVAKSVGMAQGLTNLLRSVPHNAANRMLMLPTDLLAFHDVTEESVFRGTYPPSSLREVVKRVAEVAEHHLFEARLLKEDVPKEVRKIFLPAVSTHKYLKTLRNNAFEVFDPSVQVKSPLLPFILYFNSLTNNY